MATLIWLGSQSATRSGRATVELMWPARGFFVRFNSNGVVQIENVLRRNGHDKPKYRATDGARLFWLMKDERVMQVIHYATYDGRIMAIRFVTNVRSSQWFGTVKGTRYESPVDKGRYISALLGQQSHGYYSQLQAVVLAVPLPAKSTVNYHEVLAFGTMGGASEFGSYGADVRAVVMNGTTLSIDVMSGDQFARYEALRDCVVITRDQHVEELAPGEKIVCAEYTVTRKLFDVQDRLSALRLVTTRRTLPWVGDPKKNKCLSVAAGGSHGTYICGVYGSQDVASGKIIALGVTVATPSPP